VGCAEYGSWSYGSRFEFGVIGGIIGAEGGRGCGMRIVKAIAIMFFGPVLGILAGFAVGVIVMPTQTPNSGRAPGDGFLIIGCVVLGLLVSLPVSAVLAGKLWSRSGTPQKSD
jgi:hypothetical protein